MCAHGTGLMQPANMHFGSDQALELIVFIERDLSVTPVLYYTGDYIEETLKVKPLRVGSHRHTL